MGYRGKVEERERARQLRVKAWTLQEIADELGVAKGSVSVWVRNVDFVAKPRNRNRSTDTPHPMAVKKQQQLERCREEAEEKALLASERDLYVWGLAMYLGEGAKTEASGFQLANTSSTIIAAFLRWMRTFFEIDESRLRACLYLHEDLDEETAIHHWVVVTGIPSGQFTKSYRPSSRGTYKTAKHVNGCLSIRYSDVSVFRRVMAESEALASVFANPG